LRTTDVGKDGRLAPEAIGVYLGQEDVPEQYLLRDGDLLLSRSGTVGRSLLYSDESIPATHAGYLVRFRPAADTFPPFLAYCAQSRLMQDAVAADTIESTIGNFNAEKYANVRLPWWPTTTQKEISLYLDRETARIDALIAAKRRLIDLLAERRIAQAHATVTGEHIDCATQDSNEPWLGDIPAHWTMVRLGSVFDVQLGRMLNPKRSSGPHLRPYIRNINVRWGEVDTSDLAEMNFPPAERARYALRAGDLLVNEGGAGIGRAAIWRGGIDEIYYQKSVHRVRPTSYLSVRWLHEWLRVAVDRKVFQVEGNLATIPHVPADALREYRVPCPPEGEVEALMATLDANVNRDIAIRNAALAQLPLLQERRQALITAAVTGQLDISEAA
jgi:type I restriction enzyme S subunit